MLPKERRYPLRHNPQVVLETRKRYTQLCTCWVGKTSGISQVAVIVPATVSSSAVVRNTIKRRFRGVLAQMLPEHEGIIVIIRANQEAKHARSYDIKQSLIECIE